MLLQNCGVTHLTEGFWGEGVIKEYAIEEASDLIQVE